MQRGGVRRVVEEGRRAAIGKLELPERSGDGLAVERLRNDGAVAGVERVLEGDLEGAVKRR